MSRLGRAGERRGPPVGALPRGPGASLTDQRPRILIVRTDRIGDVVLSTPVIRALRTALPRSYLAMLVRPEVRTLVAGHAGLDEVLTFDTAGGDRGVCGGVRWARRLARRRFDLAIVLHPTVRVHLLLWLAGIPHRVGYARKGAWWLTVRVPDHRAVGDQHESLATFELLRALGLGVDLVWSPPEVALLPEGIAWMDRWVTLHGVRPHDRLVVLQPAASSTDRQWPVERFAAVGDRVAEELGARVLVLTSPQGAWIGFEVVRRMRRQPLAVLGTATLGEAASVIERADVLVTNDGGMAHVAAAVGTAVVAIFGRCAPGLGAARWAPLGTNSRVVQRVVRCPVCSREPCETHGAGLAAVHVDDVVPVVLELLGAAEAQEWSFAGVPAVAVPPPPSKQIVTSCK